MMNKYTVFITLLTGLVADKIIAAMVRFGYTVAPTTEDGYLLAGDDKPSALLSLNICAKDTTAVTIRESIITCLDDEKISFYSIIVIQGAPRAAWIGSNISLSKMRLRRSALKNVPHPHLKLVKEIPPEKPQGE
jgi:hypothetical protein